MKKYLIYVLLLFSVLFVTSCKSKDKNVEASSSLSDSLGKAP